MLEGKPVGRDSGIDLRTYACTYNDLDPSRLYRYVSDQNEDRTRWKDNSLYLLQSSRLPTQDC